MGQSAPYPSDKTIIHPRSLTDRLKAVEGEIESRGHEQAGKVSITTPDLGLRVSNTLLAVLLILISLVPSAIIGALLWQGAIRTPLSTNAVEGNNNSPQSIQKALTTKLPAETVEPKHDIEGPSVTLTAPTTIEADVDKEVPFRITLSPANALPIRSSVTIGGLPEGTTLSHGRPYGETEWTLRPDEIGDLRLLMPKTASGHANLRVALVAADGTIIAKTATQLNFPAGHKDALITRPEERERIADLIAHGQKMIDVGYLPGARGYFQRAAEAGSADAAYALGTTYDPGFISESGAQGIKGNLAEARAWYERARELGSQAAQGKLQELEQTQSVSTKRPNE
jgi:hypothetical protein